MSPADIFNIKEKLLTLSLAKSRYNAKTILFKTVGYYLGEILSFSNSFCNRNVL